MWLAGVVGTSWRGERFTPALGSFSPDEKGESCPLEGCRERMGEKSHGERQKACTGLLKCVGKSELGLSREGKHILSLMQKPRQISLKTLPALWSQHIGTCRSHWIIQQ